MNDSAVIHVEGIGDVGPCRDEDGTLFLMAGDRIYSRFDILAIAAKSEEQKTAWDILNFASDLFLRENDSTFNELYGAVATHLARRFDKNEYFYQDLFKKIYPAMSGDKIIKGPHNPNHMPDAWVSHDGET